MNAMKNTNDLTRYSKRKTWSAVSKAAATIKRVACDKSYMPPNQVPKRKRAMTD